jgi:hypothetical protein
LSPSPIPEETTMEPVMPRNVRKVVEALDAVQGLLAGVGPEDWANHQGRLAEAAARACGIAQELGDTAAALVADEQSEWARAVRD